MSRVSSYDTAQSIYDVLDEGLALITSRGIDTQQLSRDIADWHDLLMSDIAKFRAVTPEVRNVFEPIMQELTEIAWRLDFPD